MSIAIDITDIDPTLRSHISKICISKPAKTQYNETPDLVMCFSVVNNIAYLPLGVWREFLDEFPDYSYPSIHLKFKKTLYSTETDPKRFRDQDQVCEEAYKKLLVDHTVFIAACTGFGKTTIGNYFTCKLKLKTAIVSHLDKVNTQWEEEFKTYSTAKVQRVIGDTPLDPYADVYIIGVQKAAKMDRSLLTSIGLVIFDEAHIATITAFRSSLLNFQPKYVIGLSATPSRADGMHKLLTMYFGPKKNFITRKETKSFTVYKVETPYKPTIRYNFVNGRSSIDWITVINSIAYNLERQRSIAERVLANKEHRIMVISDRQNECENIYAILKAAGENVLLLSGDHGAGEDTSLYRVLVAGLRKAGVGFNDPTLTMLMIVTDSKRIEQTEGRIRTVNNIIYDYVDDFKSFERHWQGRETWYLQRGATIKTINLRGYSKKEEEEQPRRLGPNTSPDGEPSLIDFEDK